MNKEIIKEGFALAEKESREKQVEEVKKIVTKTLEKIDELGKNKKDIEEQIKVLRMDLDDLKEGKLDRIVERQEKDKKAKETSVVIIIKEKEVIREVSPWYVPYRIYWNEPIYPTPIYPNPVFPNPVVYCSGGASADSGLSSVLTTNATQLQFTTINCDVAKDAAIGTYDVSGHIVHLR